MTNLVVYYVTMIITRIGVMIDKIDERWSHMCYHHPVAVEKPEIKITVQEGKGEGWG